MNPRVLAMIPLLFLAACGGGGGASGPFATVPPSGTQLAPQASAFVTITVPRQSSSAKRLPHFVSPNSTSIEILVQTVNGSAPTPAQVPPAVNPTVAALSAAGGGNCTVSGSGETCTVALPAPTGAVTYRIRVKDGAAHILSTATPTLTILPGVANQNFSVQLSGVVASVTVTKPTLTAGTSFSGPITVQAFDASGALITGSATYANGFTLTDNDATTHTSLTLNATTAKTVGPVGSPNDVVILNYDGAAIPPFTITATIPPFP